MTWFVFHFHVTSGVPENILLIECIKVLSPNNSCMENSLVAGEDVKKPNTQTVTSITLSADGVRNTICFDIPHLLLQRV